MLERSLVNGDDDNAAMSPITLPGNIARLRESLERQRALMEHERRIHIEQARDAIAQSRRTLERTRRPHPLWPLYTPMYTRTTSGPPSADRDAKRPPA